MKAFLAFQFQVCYLSIFDIGDSVYEYLLIAFDTPNIYNTDFIFFFFQAYMDARIMIRKAVANADGIKYAYETEAEAYARIMRDQNLSTEGLLSYLSIRAIQESSSNSLYINLDAPAKTSFP